MTFGKASGPPASAKQLKYLLSLIEQAGHTGFRDARGPLGLTQRQAGGKFTIGEASALIDQLVAADGDTEVFGRGVGDGAPSMEEVSAADRLDAERATVLRGMPAGLLAAELERRGWPVSLPDR
ncbi:MAG TPA: hypothetical protein VHK88_03920 [Aquihabitans sp.]|jgi:hypothetical protein|nr:hypothetical protein [Aquihabitans sp.]